MATPPLPQPMMCSLSCLHNGATSAHDHLRKSEAHDEGAVQAAAGSRTSLQKVSLEPADNRGDPDGPQLIAAAVAPPMVSSTAPSPLRCTCSHQLCGYPKQCLEAGSGCDVSLQELTREGIATRKVQEAVNRIKKPVVLEALYANTKHEELTQGTSGNENWHSWVRRTIQILGGIRGLFMILMYLEWQMMRFNEAVRRNRQKVEDRSTAAEGRAKAQDRQHLACKQAFAAALCEEQAGHRSRKAYHPWMQTSYDLEMMKAMGFSEAKPRSGPSRWSDAEVTAMLECLRGLATGDEGIHTKNPFYFVSHHSLLRMKSPDQVKALLSYVDRHYSAP